MVVLNLAWPALGSRDINPMSKPETLVSNPRAPRPGGRVQVREIHFPCSLWLPNAAGTVPSVLPHSRSEGGYKCHCGLNTRLNMPPNCHKYFNDLAGATLGCWGLMLVGLQVTRNPGLLGPHVGEHRRTGLGQVGWRLANACPIQGLGP